jgi:hypothetical protein
MEHVAPGAGAAKFGTEQLFSSASPFLRRMMSAGINTGSRSQRFSPTFMFTA